MNFAVVLVTFNRLKDLKVALEKYEQQTFKPAYLLVVNNASSDGTGEFLDQWQKEKSEFKHIVIHSPENLGGAGGFALGMRNAQLFECDFIFLADDDAFAEPDMLERLKDYYETHAPHESIAAMCTSVVNHGKYDLWHRRRVRIGFLRVHTEEVPCEEYALDAFPVNELSFVGCAVRTDVVRRIGLPRADYFIYYDDTEYSARICSCGRIMCIPAAVMNHDVRPGEGIGWKNFYGFRNSLDYIRQHYGKRRYYFAVLDGYIRKCSVLAVVFKRRPRAHRKLYARAISASLRNHFGLDTVYRPGTDINRV